MQTEPLDLTDHLIRRERRGIWLALAVIVLLGIGAVMQVLGYDTHLTHYMTLAAMIIVIGLVGVGVTGPLWRKGKLAQKRRAVRSDEFRLAAIDRACRHAFIVTMAAMSLYAALSEYWPLAVLPSALIAAFVVLGVILFLGSFLVLDGRE
ncbi:hypothetical protein PY254_16215 [Rhodanobacter sp. AS-Z3]|uniref:hypothetical protein n=1 Tax=Rhodanobacter sp. AS-Z3 TaxID=3031330 RepID=UPI00247AEE34|nr:hypothetical protein [Rhodanobacter sp. AS-Z3]WEN14758.1 hypothetical protein PY254_16215 [Rhodanobacter sp. AS-Z3]